MSNKPDARDGSQLRVIHNARVFLREVFGHRAFILRTHIRFYEPMRVCDVSNNNNDFFIRSCCAVFFIIQWIAIAIGVLAILGILYGIISLVFCRTVLRRACHFTRGLLWNALANKKCLLPASLFTICVWVLLALGILQIFI